MSHRIAIVTDDAIGERMAGPAIRAVEMARVLGTDHKVTVVSTTRAADVAGPFTVQAADGAQLVELCSAQQILVLQGHTLVRHPELARTGAYLVMDAYNVLHLEILAGSPPNTELEVTKAVRAMATQLEMGDFILCSHQAQRDLWIGYLSALGRVNPANYDDDPQLDSLIACAPFGVPDAPLPDGPAVMRGVLPGVGESSTILLWAGGVYNWFDPLLSIKAAELLADRHPDLHLVFLGTQHPSADTVATATLREAMTYARDRGLLNRTVHFLPGWVPVDERGRYLREADLGICAHHPSLETRYSYRTRMLDYLWAGIPIVTAEGDYFAALVDAEGLGATFPCGDTEAAAAALERLLTDDQYRAACAARSADVGRRMTWPRTLEPLRQYCATPRRARDLSLGRERMSTAQLSRLRLENALGPVQEYLRVNGPVRLARAAARRGLSRITGGRRSP